MVQGLIKSEPGVDVTFDAKNIANENNIPLTECNLPPLTTRGSDEVYFHPLTSHELRKIVHSFPSNKTSKMPYLQFYL